MESGLILKYGKLVPGREIQAFELFEATQEWLADQRKAGIVSYFEPYFYATGVLDAEVGFWIVKGDREKLWKMVEEERFRWLVNKAAFVVEHLQFEWLTVGEGIQEQMERAAKLAAEFVTVH